MDIKSFIQINFTGLTEEQIEMLIALLADIGYTGFEEGTNSLDTFIAAENFDRDGLDTIINLVPVEYSMSIVEEQNWNAKWESSFEPIIVNDKVAIRATFHPPIPTVQHEIIITPKMSFGTGHHATTFLMIEQMLGIDLTNKVILDFGTGTGILAILAEKMGANAITAIDNDEWSIANAKENIAANECNRVLIQKADTIPSNKKYDIILANINLNVILSNLPVLSSASKTSTIILLSGCLKPDEPALITALADNGFNSVNTSQKGEWICLEAIKAVKVSPI